MDPTKNFELFVKELKGLLTEREYEKSRSWMRPDGEEVEINTPYPHSMWRHFPLSPPQLHTPDAAGFIKRMLKRYE